MVAQRPLHGLTILVVDDHRDTVAILQEYLEADGATVFGATSAKAGLALAETHALDAALVDLSMPREDGWWLLSQLRASRMEGAATVPVFAISGERHDALDPASGFAGFFLKPIDLEALEATLALLERRRR